jgi:hypothetical protein
MKPTTKESGRRVCAACAMWGGWLGSIGVFTYASLSFDPDHGDFAPQWVGFAFIMLIGVAIAGSSARARMRLTDTIVGAFKAGFKAAEHAAQRRKERDRDE